MRHPACPSVPLICVKTNAIHIDKMCVLRPVIAHKGYVIADLTFSGTPCHSSDPSSGASALHAAARSLDRLQIGLCDRDLRFLLIWGDSNDGTLP